MAKLLLSPAQKEEIRRLTQLANRRIKAAERAYRKQGLDVLPYEVVGEYQIKEKWNTANTPLSRSVKFDDLAAYRKHIQFLRSFEVSRPGIKQYTKIQQNKTLMAVNNSLGVAPPDELVKRIDKMTAPQLSQFWKSFSERAAKLGVKYSSQSAMEQTLAEFFPEDMLNFNTVTKQFGTG